MGTGRSVHPPSPWSRFPLPSSSLLRIKATGSLTKTHPHPSGACDPLPLLYSHIQDVYWDVGFLRYFQLKQIPNFLLALPMATLGMVAAYMYYRDNPARCLRLGLWDGGANKWPDKPTPGFYSPRVFLYVVHATMLLGFGTFCMHVQVRNESVENVYVRGFQQV